MTEVLNADEVAELLGVGSPTRDVGYVYLVRCDQTGLVKVGTSVNVRHRLRSLQSQSPTELSVVAIVRVGHVSGRYGRTSVEAARDMERACHERFAYLRVRGEWFSGTQEIHAAFSSGLRGIGPTRLHERGRSRLGMPHP